MRNVIDWFKNLSHSLEEKPVNNAIIAGFAVMLLHGSYFLWKIYILLHPDLHQFINIAVFFREILITAGIFLGFLLLIVALHKTKNNFKVSGTLVFLMLLFISLSMAYQGYTFGSMSLPSGVMLIAATIVGFILFDRRSVYWVSALAGVSLVATTVAAILGWLPYAPKLLESNFPSDQRAAVFLLLNMLLVVTPAYLTVMLIADYFINQLKRRTLQLQQLSERDPLTQLSNRRVVYDYLARYDARLDLPWRQHTIIMMDIDFFKKINDQWGHLIGDEVLQHVATELQAAAESGDLVGRFGGEEFIVIMPTEQVDRAEAFAAYCQRQLSLYHFRPIDGVYHQLTASFGIVSASQGAGLNAQSLEQLIGLADQALYRAKQAGRACTVVL
ncbi:MAG: GGDEF domain-containing protein [Moraxellaceae bacterium]